MVEMAAATIAPSMSIVGLVVFSFLLTQGVSRNCNFKTLVTKPGQKFCEQQAQDLGKYKRCYRGAPDATAVLSTDHVRAFAFYTSSEYGKFNERVRTGHAKHQPLSTEDDDLLFCLSDGLRRLTSKDYAYDKLLRRNLDSGIGDRLANMKIGDIFQDATVLSATMKIDHESSVEASKLKDLHSSIIIKPLKKKKTAGRIVVTASTFRCEGEVLFPPLTKFCLVNTWQKKTDIQGHSTGVITMYEMAEVAKDAACVKEVKACKMVAHRNNVVPHMSPFLPAAVDRDRQSDCFGLAAVNTRELRPDHVYTLPPHSETKLTPMCNDKGGMDVPMEDESVSLPFDDYLW